MIKIIWITFLIFCTLSFFHVIQVDDQYCLTNINKIEFESKEQLEKLWKNSKTKTLTNKDTALVLTGSLLNQWFTDENYLKTASPTGGIFKRFDDILNEFNRDSKTILIREAKDIVENKHKKRDFVNKGDIYATEINDKKIL